MRRFRIPMSRQAPMSVAHHPVHREETRAHWYLPFSVCVDLLGAALPVGATIVEVHEPHPLVWRPPQPCCGR